MNRKLAALGVVVLLGTSACSSLGRKSAADCVCANDPVSTEAGLERLTVGTSKFVDLKFEPAHSGVFVGNPNVLAATVAVAGPKIQLVLQPLRAGSSNVSVVDRKGEMRYQAQFQVTSVDLADLANRFAELVKDTPGVTVKLQRDKVLLDGEIPTVAQLGRITSLAGNDAYSPHIVNVTRLATAYFTELAAKAQGEIAKFAPGVTVRAVNGKLWLEGKAENADQLNRASKVASLLLPESLPEDPLAAKGKSLPPQPFVQNFVTIEGKK